MRLHAFDDRRMFAAAVNSRVDLVAETFTGNENALWVVGCTDICSATAVSGLRHEQKKKKNPERGENPSEGDEIFCDEIC